MHRLLRNKKGFTMVELIVVIIIVGILAAVAVPMMTANIDRAKRTEAVATLGTIRTAERLVKSETGNYVNVAAGAFGTTADINNYIKAGDLNGRYYNDANYSVSGTSITATGSGSLGCNMNLNTGVINEP